MANLKAIRVRLSSVKSTRQITSAMKMVAAAIDTATVTEETFRTAIYQTRIGDTDYSFMAVREGGTWKLSGI